jgi:hypothetical protein
MSWMTWSCGSSLRGKKAGSRFPRWPARTAALLVAGVLALSAHSGQEAQVHAAAPAQAAVQSTEADFDIENGHFYTQAAEGRGGFAITNDDGIRFWDEYQRLGGPHLLGYPISRRYIQEGVVMQAVQTGVLRWDPATQSAQLTDGFDLLSQAGEDAWLEAVKSIPRPIEDDSSGGDAARSTQTRLSWLTNDAIREAYFANPNPARIPAWSNEASIALYGLPTSRPQAYGPMIAQRFRRIALQLWVQDVPGQPRAGTVTRVLGGDVMKEAGLIPYYALVPQPMPGTLSLLPERPFPGTRMQLYTWGLRGDASVRVDVTGPDGRVLELPGLAVRGGEVSALLPELLAQGEYRVLLTGEQSGVQLEGSFAIVAPDPVIDLAGEAPPGGPRLTVDLFEPDSQSPKLIIRGGNFRDGEQVRVSVFSPEQVAANQPASYQVTVLAPGGVFEHSVSFRGATGSALRFDRAGVYTVRAVGLASRTGAQAVVFVQSERLPETLAETSSPGVDGVARAIRTGSDVPRPIPGLSATPEAPALEQVQVSLRGFEPGEPVRVGLYMPSAPVDPRKAIIVQQRAYVRGGAGGVPGGVEFTWGPTHEIGTHVVRALGLWSNRVAIVRVMVQGGRAALPPASPDLAAGLAGDAFVTSMPQVAADRVVTVPVLRYMFTGFAPGELVKVAVRVAVEGGELLRLDDVVASMQRTQSGMPAGSIELGVSLPPRLIEAGTPETRLAVQAWAPLSNRTLEVTLPPIGTLLPEVQAAVSTPEISAEAGMRREVHITGKGEATIVRLVTYTLSGFLPGEPVRVGVYRAGATEPLEATYQPATVDAVDRPGGRVSRTFLPPDPAETYVVRAYGAQSRRIAVLTLAPLAPEEFPPAGAPPSPEIAVVTAVGGTDHRDEPGLAAYLAGRTLDVRMSGFAGGEAVRLVLTPPGEAADGSRQRVFDVQARTRDTADAPAGSIQVRVSLEGPGEYLVRAWGLASGRLGIARVTVPEPRPLLPEVAATASSPEVSASAAVGEGAVESRLREGRAAVTRVVRAQLDGFAAGERVRIGLYRESGANGPERLELAYVTAAEGSQGERAGAVRHGFYLPPGEQRLSVRAYGIESGRVAVVPIALAEWPESLVALAQRGGATLRAAVRDWPPVRSEAPRHPALAYRLDGFLPGEPVRVGIYRPSSPDGQPALEVFHVAGLDPAWRTPGSVEHQIGLNGSADLPFDETGEYVLRASGALSGRGAVATVHVPVARTREGADEPLPGGPPVTAEVLGTRAGGRLIIRAEGLQADQHVRVSVAAQRPDVEDVRYAYLAQVYPVQEGRVAIEVPFGASGLHLPEAGTYIVRVYGLTSHTLGVAWITLE